MNCLFALFLSTANREIAFALQSNSDLAYGTAVERPIKVVVEALGAGIALTHPNSEGSKVVIEPERLEGKQKQDERIELSVLPEFDFEHTKKVMVQIQFWQGEDRNLRSPSGDSGGTIEKESTALWWLFTRTCRCAFVLCGLQAASDCDARACPNKPFLHFCGLGLQKRVFWRSWQVLG